jgi:hypothetical protein
MSIEKRRFIRFFLDIPVLRSKSDGEILRTVIKQVSVAGCMAEWDETILTGDRFRIEVELPNKNRLPLFCKALYKFPGRGIGSKFIDISQFEQELLGQIISKSLKNDGLLLPVDPFAIPPTFLPQNVADELSGRRKRREDDIIEEIMNPKSR